MYTVNIKYSKEILITVIIDESLHDFRFHQLNCLLLLLLLIKILSHPQTGRQSIFIEPWTKLVCFQQEDFAIHNIK